MRDLTPNIDRLGNMRVRITVDGRANGEMRREIGTNDKPSAVAKFLRDLADDVAAADQNGAVA